MTRRHASEVLRLAVRWRELQEQAAEARALDARSTADALQDALDAARREEEAALEGWRSAVASSRLDLNSLSFWNDRIGQETARAQQAQNACDQGRKALDAARENWTVARGRTGLARDQRTSAHRREERRLEERAMAESAEMLLIRRGGAANAY
ncbi:hypothetical protein ACFPIF_12015 [Brevundimonas faecalis]|uniref:hypothetical protein n=1 Tax=Brevundimonas faecalis TaxID=947378 RepID=UPI003617C05B